MRAGGERVGQVLTLVAGVLFLGPPLAVALTGMGAPLWLALAIPVLVTAALGAWARGVPAVPIALAGQRPLLAALAALIFCVALVQCTRASVFAYDVGRRAWSVHPADQFRSQHNCFTAYAEAARFAASGGVNVYDSALYRPGGVPRRLGPLTVDPFHYPPPFLLLPAALRAVAPDFFDMRRVWFGVQVLVLAGVMLWTARFVGGQAGRALALASVLPWATPNLWGATQVGNFQLTAIALALAGAVMAWSGRAWPGTALLTYAAAAKVFPAMLVLHLVGAQRWAGLKRVVVSGFVIAAITFLVVGADPFVHFVRDEFPRVASGASFPQTEQPAGMRQNQSIYGLTVRVRALGAEWLDQPAGRLVAQVYAALLAILAIVAGHRAAGPGTAVTSAGRFAHVIRWLAILNLASFASPFVGAMYGSVGTIWLIAALAVGAGTTRARSAWLCALVPAFLVPWLVPTVTALPTPSPGWLAAMIPWQVGAIAVNAWAAWPRPVARVASTESEQPMETAV